ncbi:diguanylate cyclase [Paenibacillus sp. JX-17]|uniref:Diguanylate cyclase n=2 Tax=Paenibacillus lacisoli TaxID=3064525 RepID=A0ABT9CBB5_9BACL|nr:diguanylate cyclase [Paenibacillus sp. JX-17]
MDITTFDYPYIDELLRKSLQDWYRQSCNLPWLADAAAAIYNRNAQLVEAAGRLAEMWPELEDEAAALSGQVMDKLHGVTSMVIRKDAEMGSEICLYGLPLRSRNLNEIFAVAVIAVRGSASAEHRQMEEMLASSMLHYRACFYRCYELMFMEDFISAQRQSAKEIGRRSILARIVKQVHDITDVDLLLNQVFENLNELYPNVRVTLYVSQDRESENVLVQPLVLDRGHDDICAQAFLTGQVVQRKLAGEEEAGGLLEIGVPLRGNQGVYGVFLLQFASSDTGMNQVDLEMMTMIADVAGTSFENAKLLEQSNLLIQELRLINELAQRLNQSLQLSEIFQYAVHELIGIFQADHCLILQLNEEQKVFEIMAGTFRFPEHDPIPCNSGFSGLVYQTGEPMILPDYAENGRVTSRFMENTGGRSLMAVPLRSNGRVEGVIIVTHQQPQFFSYDNYKLLQMLAPHISLALSNASLHAEVRRMASLDVLTGLHIRHYLDKLIQQRQEEDYCGTLLLVDIDQFKQVNDTYGHQVGDRILQQVSEIVKTSVRQEDMPARWGGEELAIYFPKLGVQQAYAYAELIRQRVQQETSPAVTVSSGIADWSWMDEQISLETLFYHADMALYEAKNGGRNRIMVHEAGTTA